MAKKVRIPNVNERLLDKYIRHAVYMEQLKASEAAAISRLLRTKVFPQLHDKLISELSKVKNLKIVGSIKKIKRIKQMMVSVEKIATAGAIKAGKRMTESLKGVAEFEAEWNSKVIKETVPLDIDFTVPSNQVLRAMVSNSVIQGHKMETWLKGYSKSVQSAVLKQIKISVATGESIPAISKRLRTILRKKANQATSIARTATSQIVHNARELTFNANKDLITKVQWISTLDDRTTLICINFDNKIFNIGEGERPPAHFNCRSTVVPIVTSWQEFGVEDPPPATRASMNGAIPANTNYRQWLKRQPKSVQYKVLGKTRAELYRSGRVKIDRFVNRDLKPLTLVQLAKREGISISEIKQK